MSHRDDSLISGFTASRARHPSRPALWVDGAELTYDVLGAIVDRIAATILEHQRESNPLAAVFAHRSVTAYAGVLGVLAAGRGYVPLNPKFPAERTRAMLRRSEADVVVVGRESLPEVDAILRDAGRSLVVILPDLADVTALSAQFPEHRFIASNALCSSPPAAGAREVSPDSVAYLMFTSGSTGDPKGVAVRESNVRPYVDYITARYGVNAEDRLSQAFDLTFDLSVHDMFVCWQAGACLCCVPEASTMAPAKFIRDVQLSMWFSVPSVIAFMMRLRMLRPGLFPSLRWSLFCGEPLPEAGARAWQEAAPNSVVENLYGPTEATIAITHHRWDEASADADCRNGIVSIGEPFDGQRTCVVDSEGNPQPPEEPGELCLAGSQVTAGYWNDPEKTAASFVRLPGQGDVVWYRTGDHATQDKDGRFYCLGRMDNQVKIRGYRVELQEVDFALRRACGTEQVVSVAWPVRDGSAEGIVAFVSDCTHRDEKALLARCGETLPDYMVPRRIHFLEEMPLNANGKIDRRRLLERLEVGQA